MAIHINDRLSHLKLGSDDFAQTVDQIYGVLCEAVHPNVEAQGVLWRRASPGRDGRCRVRFEPSASESPVKLLIIDAVQIANKIHLAYCRDLWWVAAEVACMCRLRRNAETDSLSVPIPGDPTRRAATAQISHPWRVRTLAHRVR
jgi:hypothetical protein